MKPEEIHISKTKIYLKKNGGSNQFTIQYLCDGQKRILQVLDGEICEISGDSINKKEQNFDDDESR